MDRTRDTVVVGAWAELHELHPFVPSLKHRMTVPNPEYEKNEAIGKSNRGVPSTLKLYEKVGKWYRFPRAVANPYVGASDIKVVDETLAGEEAPMRSLITLRPKQVAFVDDLVKALNSGFGAVGQAEAGFGKTVCFLEVMSRLGKKTLILVHKEFLMTQWVERILGTVAAAQKLGLGAAAFGEVSPPCLDVTADEVGIVQQDRCEWEGKKVVIAMAQSLLARNYGAAFYESFGLLGVDEVHRFAAPTFQKTIVMFRAAKRLGVTATPDRNDGLESVFFGHIGKIAAVGEGRTEKPRVNLVRSQVVVTDTVRRSFQRGGRDDLVKVTSFLVGHETRNRQIVQLLVRAAQKDRKVLVLSDRRQHLEDLRGMFIEACQQNNLGVSTDYYVGGMDLEARKRAEKMQVLFATFAMAKEGLDVPALDTLLMVTPKGDVHQAVGRIMRSHSEKRAPVVVDIVDTQIGICKNLAAKREREYRQLGWIL